jgi:hypothetical protein
VAGRSRMLSGNDASPEIVQPQQVEELPDA